MERATNHQSTATAGSSHATTVTIADVLVSADRRQHTPVQSLFNKKGSKMSKIMPISARRVGRTARRVKICNEPCPGVIEGSQARLNNYRRFISHGPPPIDLRTTITLRRKRSLAVSVHIMLERFFGPTITVASGRLVPVRLIGEQHVREDLGFIPSFVDWVRCIRPEPWMGRAQPIHRDVDPFTDVAMSKRA